MSAVLDQAPEATPPETPEAAEATPISPDRIFTPGIRTDLSHDDYLAIDALSASGIKTILHRSPWHYQQERLTPREPTDAMLMGTALHQRLLEPDKYSVVVAPEINRRTKAGKAEWAEWQMANAGRLVLTAGQAETVERMNEAVRRHPVFDELICDGAAEVTFQWNDARHGDRVPCKCRFDYLRSDRIALDLKTTSDASPEGFARAVAAYRYHYQAAWYNTGHEHLRNESLQAFLFIAVENVAPFGCAVYSLESNAIAFGIDQCERAMLLYADARRSGYWRPYPTTIQRLILPRWATSLPIPTY